MKYIALVVGDKSGNGGSSETSKRQECVRQQALERHYFLSSFLYDTYIYTLQLLSPVLLPSDESSPSLRIQFNFHSCFNWFARLNLDYQIKQLNRCPYFGVRSLR